MRPRFPPRLALLGLLLGCSDGLIDPELYDPLPRFDDLDFNLVQPSAPFLLWEIRQGFGPGQDPVVARGGTASRESIPPAILAQFDMIEAPSGFDVGCLPGYCFKYVVTLEGSTVRTWTTVPELVEFMGPIDNRVEAAIVAKANAYYWTQEEGTGGIRELSDGFELVVLEMVRSCAPVQVDRLVISISATGTQRVLRREVWTKDNNSCV
jgi:hypothetical protein